jgi:hypothetical protein
MKLIPMALLAATLLAPAAHADNYSLTLNQRARLDSCKGFVEINDGAANDQVNVVFGDIEQCSNFDILSENGQYVADYKARKLQGPNGNKSGSFTLPQEFLSFGAHYVKVVLKSNSGAHQDVIEVRYRVEGPSTPGSSEVDRCFTRLLEAGCLSAGWQLAAFQRNIEACRHFESASGKTGYEVFLTRRGGNLVTVKTRGTPACDVTAYELDTRVAKIKVIENRVFALAEGGELYYVLADGTVWELLTSDYRSYHLADLAGAEGGTGVRLIWAWGYSTVLSADELDAKVQNGQSRRIALDTSWGWWNVFGN